MERRVGESVVLVGTAHISPDSVAEVREVILRERPAVVAVELDKARLDYLQDKNRWENLSLLSLIEGRNAFFFLAQALLSSFQRQMGKQYGVQPGSELLMAVKTAEEVEAEIVLADRDITITLQKAWRQMRVREKLRLFWELMVLMIPPEEGDDEAAKKGTAAGKRRITKRQAKEMKAKTKKKTKKTVPGPTDEPPAEEGPPPYGLATDEVIAPGATVFPGTPAPAKPKERPEPKRAPKGADPLRIRNMMKEDVLSAMLKELRAIAPTVATVLIDERDVYLAKKIAEAAKRRGMTVAVIGAGHLRGVQRNIELSMAGGELPRYEDLNHVPEKRIPWGTILGYGLPIAIVLLIVYGFIRDAQTGDFMAALTTLGNTLSYWFLLHIVLTGIATALARGHPWSIFVGAMVSPFTALHPALAAGWFAGAAEIKARKLTNRDLLDVFRLDSWDGYFKNKVIRVLLVTALANVGSSIATFAAFPIFLKYGLGGLRFW